MCGEIEKLPEAANRVCAVQSRNDFAEEKNDPEIALQAVVLITDFWYRGKNLNLRPSGYEFGNATKTNYFSDCYGDAHCHA
ncbi:MAG: hypothetical protein WBM71_14875, partial [Sedimenticolaceae bacterium]